MGITRYPFWRAAATLSLLCIIYGCAVTTDSIESSSKTVENSTDASSPFTSSTSPGSDTSKASEKERALAFSKVKLERIKTDMAVGGGEHITSLATLLGVPAHNQQEFFALTRSNFSTLFSSEQTTAEEMLARLEDELSANPGLLK